MTTLVLLETTFILEAHWRADAYFLLVAQGFAAVLQFKTKGGI